MGRSLVMLVKIGSVAPAPLTFTSDLFDDHRLARRDGDGDVIVLFAAAAFALHFRA